MDHIHNDIVDQPESSKFLSFEIENITVVRPLMLKVYYWEYFNIPGLNKKLLGSEGYIEHDLWYPVNEFKAQPLKIVFWLKNISKEKLTLNLRRIQNCQCKLLQTRIGINRFRYLYHCPHRQLLHISQELIVMNPDDLVALTVVAYFYLYGYYVLSYEIRCSDSRIIKLNFHLHIGEFNPIKCVLTRELLPVHIQEYRRMAQPIWVANVSSQTIQILFRCNERGIRLRNPSLVVPHLSTWPLIVEYRPNEFENNMKLLLQYNCSEYHIPLSCQGVLQDIPQSEGAPIYDHDCTGFPYILYPNKLVFNAEFNEEQFLLVAVHNYDHKCVKFMWQPYSIGNYFVISFDPKEFTLKPRHSRLCLACLKSFDKPLHFTRVPVLLEVYRVLRKDITIAKELLEEIESIDSEKLKYSNFLMYLYIQVDVKVNYSKSNSKNTQPKTLFGHCQKAAMPLIIPSSSSLDMTINDKSKNSQDVTIFEKLFWEYLSKSSFSRDTSDIPTNLTYEEVIAGDMAKKKKAKEFLTHSEKANVFNILCYVMADACRDLGRNYHSVPPEYLDPI